MELVAESSWTYAAITASVAGSAVIPALPSESMLATAMGLAAAGELNLAWACLAAGTGAVLGDLAAYTVGRSVSVRARRRAARSHRGEAALRWLQDHQASWGPGLVIGGRFVPGGTMAVGVSAGLLPYPLRRFILFSVIGAVLWTGYGVGIGFLGRAVFPDNTWAGVALAIGIALGTGVVAQIASARRRRRRVTQA